MKQREQVAMLKRPLALRETRRDEEMLDRVVTIPTDTETPDTETPDTAAPDTAAPDTPDTPGTPGTPGTTMGQPA